MDLKRRLDLEYLPKDNSKKENKRDMENLPPLLKDLLLDKSMEEYIMDTKELTLLLEDFESENSNFPKIDDNKPPFKICPPRVGDTVHLLGVPCPREVQS